MPAAATRLDCTPGMLPGVVQDVARLTSPLLAIRFARRFGNAKLYVPRRIGAAHPLARCLGPRGAQALCAAMGGETHVVPRATPFLRWLDARALCVLGLSRSEIAVRLGIGPRHVRKLLDGFSPDGIETDALVREIGRHYGVGRGRRGTHAGIPGAQRDFGWPSAPGGMRLTLP